MLGVVNVNVVYSGEKSFKDSKLSYDFFFLVFFLLWLKDYNGNMLFIFYLKKKKGMVYSEIKAIIYLQEGCEKVI